MSKLIWTYRIENAEDWNKSIPSLEKVLSEYISNSKNANALMIIYDEVISNIFNYSIQRQPLVITTKIWNNTHTIHIEFIDNTAPYNPLSTQQATERKENQLGGWGLALIKKLSDQLDYEYDDGHNILTISKNINIEH